MSISLLSVLLVVLKLVVVSGTVHTGVEVHGMDSEMSGLVE